MPRPRKTISIDEKINEQKQVVSRAKAKYESALAELNDLMKKRDEIQNKQLLEAISSSDRSFEEILEFIKGHSVQEKEESFER